MTSVIRFIFTYLLPVLIWFNILPVVVFPGRLLFSKWREEKSLTEYWPIIFTLGVLLLLYSFHGYAKEKTALNHFSQTEGVVLECTSDK